MASQLENRRRVAAVCSIAMPPRAGVTRRRRGAFDRPSAAPAGCGAAPKSMEGDVLKRCDGLAVEWSATLLASLAVAPHVGVVSELDVATAQRGRSETRSPERTHVEQQLVICPSRSARCLAQVRWNLMRARPKSVAMPSRLVLPDSSAISAQFVFGESGDKLACAWRAGHTVRVGSVESRHDSPRAHRLPGRNLSRRQDRILPTRTVVDGFISQHETCCAKGKNGSRRSMPSHIRSRMSQSMFLRHFPVLGHPYYLQDPRRWWDAAAQVAVSVWPAAKQDGHGTGDPPQDRRRNGAHPHSYRPSRSAGPRIGA